MSRVSSTVVFAGVVSAIVALNLGCTVQATVKTKNRFVEDNVSKEASANWNGEPIKITAEGVGLAVNGGLEVRVNPGATKITATARMLAMAEAEDKTSADRSIADAKNTFAVTSSGGVWNVTCGHGNSYGTSNGGESGCEKLVVTIPAGTAAQKLDLTALSGNGSVVLELASATLSNLGVNGKGDISGNVPTTKDANIGIVAEQADDITISLPRDFAADEVIVQADGDQIDTSAFPDLKLDATTGAGTRGTAGEGAKSVKLTSKEFAGSTGKITLGAF